MKNLGLAILFVVLACSCKTTLSGFACDEDDDCTISGIPGFCENNGLCSYEDLNCDGGRRYGSESGELSGQCVGSLDPIDAGVAGDAATLAAATPTLETRAVKTFHFAWVDVEGATHYKLLERVDSTSEFLQVGQDIATATQEFNHVVPLHRRINAGYILQSCNASACVDSAVVNASGTLQQAIGYVKASNTDARDEFGASIALSGDGNTLAIGAPYEGSNATGIGGNQNENTADRAGAVYIFVKSGTTWSQQEYIKASNTGARDNFGFSVALSLDGNTLAVGAMAETSNASGIGGNQNDDSASFAGAVYVYRRSNSTWSQQEYLKGSNTESPDTFGSAVALSDDGNTLAVGAEQESSSARGIGGNQNDNSAVAAGAAYIFVRGGTSWSQQAYIKASNAEAYDRFGGVVALSGDGSTLAVGASDEASAGINAPSDNSAAFAGAVYVFGRNGAVWGQQAYLKASNIDASDLFGESVSLSSDGSTLAVGAHGEASGNTADPTDNSAGEAGAAYVFTRNGATWGEQAYLKANNTEESDSFGVSVALSADGKTLAIGARFESSSATGIMGNPGDNSVDFSGALYVFTQSAATWSQKTYIKASNTRTYLGFGWTLALSDDGNTLAIGTPRETSSATGVGGDQTNDTLATAGAVYLF